MEPTHDGMQCVACGCIQYADPPKPAQLALSLPTKGRKER